MTEAKRNSRWDRAPKRDANGEPIVARVVDTDIAILRALSDYRYLPADYIAALTGRSLSATQARLEILCREPNCYIVRPLQQRSSAAANTRRLIYELDDRGGEELRAHGREWQRRKVVRNFAHELMACTIAASFELGAKSDSRIRIIHWADLLASPQFPAATRLLPSPYAIPFVRENRPEHIVPDWRPFVIERNFATRSYLFVAGFEADCGTEPLDARDDDRTSIRSKFAAYLACLQQDVPRRHFGAQTFMAPFVTTSETRMRAMIDLLARMQPGELARRFLFKHAPAFAATDKPAPATGHMLTEPWQRAGFPPFSFVDP